MCGPLALHANQVRQSWVLFLGGAVNQSNLADGLNELGFAVATHLFNQGFALCGVGNIDLDLDEFMVVQCPQQFLHDAFAQTAITNHYDRI